MSLPSTTTCWGRSRPQPLREVNSALAFRGEPTCPHEASRNGLHDRIGGSQVTAHESRALFPHKHQNPKLSHRIGCGGWVRMLRFLRPEKISLSLRGTSFFFSTRFLRPILRKFSCRPDGSPAAFLRSFFSSPSFPGP